MADTDPFVLACLHAPLDAGPRLAFSDWLEEYKGWDALRLAALRGIGRWTVRTHGAVDWQFEMQSVLAQLYDPADLAADHEQRANVAAMGLARLRFGRVPAGGPTCSACKAVTVGLEQVTRRPNEAPAWLCRTWECMYPGFANPAHSMSYHQIAQAIQAGIYTPTSTSWTAQALGLPEPPDAE